MKKKIFLRITVAVASILAFFIVNVSINENSATENAGLLTIGKSAKADCNPGIILDGRCNGTRTRCFYDANYTDCDVNS